MDGQAEYASQLEQAVQIASSPGHNPEIFRQAIEFVTQAKDDVKTWQVSLPLFLRTPRASEVVRVYCLEVLNAAISRQFAAESLSHIKEALVDYMRSTFTQESGAIDPPSIQNKLTQTMTLLFVALYPNDWPNFFDDVLLLTFSNGDGSRDNLPGVAFFLRMCNSVHDEVADVLIARSPEEARRNMVIKDHIRERDMRKLVSAWHEILSQWRDKNDEVVAMCFRVLGRWVSWIDISIVVNDTMFSLLLQFLASESIVRNAALETLNEIVGKKMKSRDKLELMQFLNLTEIVRQLVATPAMNKQGEDDYDSDFAEAIAKLVNTVGQDVVKVCGNEENPIENRQGAHDFLLAFVPFLLRFFTDIYDEVSVAVFSFMGDLLMLLRKERRLSGALSQQHAELLPPILEAIITKSKYDADAVWGEEDEETEEAEFQGLRKKLKIFQDGISGIDEDLYINFVYQVIKARLDQLATNPSTVGWQEADLAIYQLHIFGELAIRGGAGGSIYSKGRPNNAAAERLIELMAKIMECGIGDYPHPGVKLQMMEIFWRYANFFENHTSLIPSALEIFIKGVHDSHVRVRHRAWYLFNRFVKHLRQHIGEISQTVLEAISDVLVIQAVLPKADQEMSDSDVSITEDTTFESQLFLFEAVGIISSIPSLPVERQTIFVRTLATPLFADIEKHLNTAGTGDPLSAMQIHHNILALGQIAKGFNDWTAGKSPIKVAPPEVGNEFLQITDAILVALERLSGYAVIREAARSAFSRMVGVLGPGILPFIPRWIEGLLAKSSSKSEIAQFLRLLEQLIHAFKNEVYSILDALLSPLLNRIFTALSQPTSGTDDEIALTEVRREYLNFLLAILNSNLSSSLVSEANQATFETALNAVEHFAKDLSDPATQKIAFNCLAKLCHVFGPSTASIAPVANGDTNGTGTAGALSQTQLPTPHPLAGFEGLMTERFSLLCWEVPSDPSFNPKDAQSRMVLSEIAFLQKILWGKLGEVFEGVLRSVAFPRLGVPADAVEGYVDAIRRLDGKEWRQAHLRFVEQAGFFGRR